MIENILNYIVQHKLVIFLFAVFILFVLLLLTLLRKRKIAYISAINSVVASSVFLLDHYQIITTQILGYSFLLVASLLMLLAIIINFIILIVVSCRENKITRIVKAHDALDSTVLGYFDKKGMFLFYTDHFYNLFNTTRKSYKNDTAKVLVGDAKLRFTSLSNFLLGELEEDKDFDFELKNGDEFSLTLLKRKIIKDSKLIGFTLSINNLLDNQHLSKADHNSSNIEVYLDLIDTAVLYYEEELNSFILNREMMRLINSSNKQLKEEALTSLIHPDDIASFTFKKISKEELKEDSRTILRIKTTNAYLWFEESQIYLDKFYYVLRQTSFSKYKKDYHTTASLVDRLTKTIESNSNFGLLKLSVNDYSKFSEKLGIDAAMVVVSQYFNNLSQELGNINLKVYKGSKDSYYIIIDDRNIFDLILSSLRTKSSLLNTALIFNNIHLEMKNTLGIVDSTLLGKLSVEEVLKAVDDALQLASDDRYLNDYSIYTPLKEAEGYDFREAGIDLSDDFLEDILK